MIRLNLNREPQWVELLPGVRVLAAPATTAIMGAARRDPILEGVDETTDQDDAALRFAKAVAFQVISDWTGIEGEDGAPAAVTRENVDALLDNYRIFEGWQLEYMARWLGLEQEKNASAPLPSGISAGAPNTAEPAPRAAKPARRTSTNRKA